MNLVIDAGNTRTKYAFFENNILLETGYETDGIFEKTGRWKDAGKSIELFLSGSGRLEEDVKMRLKEQSDFWLEAEIQIPLPIKIGYDTPDTLGFDRIAICVGAMDLFPGKKLLVIDSGTAITYNYVNENGVFLGGNISPGQEIRFRALHQYTARLPYVQPDTNYGGMGRTTEQAIRNGVMSGLLFEITAYIHDFYNSGVDSQVVITGGNSHFLRNHLKAEACFQVNLGFQGLNAILEYNKNLRK